MYEYDLEEIEVSQEIVKYVLDRGYEIYAFGFAYKDSVYVTGDYENGYYLVEHEDIRRTIMPVLKVRKKECLPRYYLDTKEENGMKKYKIKDREGYNEHKQKNVTFLDQTEAEDFLYSLNKGGG